MSMDGKELGNRSRDDREIEELIRESARDAEIPVCLKPENIGNLLDKKKSGKTGVWKVRYTIAAAVCCVVILGAAAAGGILGGDRPGGAASAVLGQSSESEKKDISEGEVEDSPESGLTIASASGYDEIYKYIKAERKQREKEEQYIESRTEDSMAGGEEKSLEQSAEFAVSEDSGGAASFSDTNIRQEGVAEGDIIKTDGKNLYILDAQKVQIVNIENQELKQMGTIRLDDGKYGSEIYIKDERLVLVYTRTEYEDGEAGYGQSYRQYTVAETYDVSNPAEPVSVGKITQSGEFHTMRIVGDYIYLFSNFYADIAAQKKDIQAYIPEVQGQSIDSRNILMPQVIRGSQYTVVSSFSMKEPGEKADSKAIFGSSGLTYVSSSNIYVCEAYYNSDISDVSQTYIRKVSYQDGKLEAVGQTKVDGTLNDSFSIDEYKGNLRLVTTVSPVDGGSVSPILRIGAQDSEKKSDAKESNSLFILDGNLQELGRIEGLAEEETVYSARFMGDTGYFVTYKQVDPLFSVDLSDPSAPVVTGELKIPGFSEYLHPYGEGLLLGIGMDMDETGTAANGVKLSMFDISDPGDVKEIEKYVLEDCYSTDIAYNYKAALIDTERNLIGFSANGDIQHYYVFSYDENAGFQCIFDRELSGYGSGRGVYSGDTFYLAAGNTVESYSMVTFEKIDDIVL